MEAGIPELAGAGQSESPLRKSFVGKLHHLRKMEADLPHERFSHDPGQRRRDSSGQWRPMIQSGKVLRPNYNEGVLRYKMFDSKARSRFLPSATGSLIQNSDIVACRLIRHERRDITMKNRRSHAERIAEVYVGLPRPGEVPPPCAWQGVS